MLASGADDSLVLLWDLLSSQSGSVGNISGGGGSGGTGGVNGVAAGGSGGQTGAGGAAGAAAGTAAATAPTGDIARSPTGAWRCDYEVSNISWAPPSLTASQGGDWVGVAAGRGIWGVKL